MVAKFIALLLSIGLVLAPAAVTFDHDEYGPTTIQHDGDEFITSGNDGFGRPYRRPHFYWASFSDGTQTPLGAPGIPSGTTDSATYTEWTIGDFVIRMTSSAPDGDTYQAQVCVTNNDSSMRTLMQIGAADGIGVTLPYAIAQVEGGLNTGWVAKRWGNLFSYSGGRIAQFSDSFEPWSNQFVTGSLDETVDWVPFSMQFEEYGMAGIDYGETECVNTYLRWGSSSDDLETLAAEGREAWLSAYPQVLDMPGRLPLAALWIGDPSGKGANNPAGYAWDSDLDCTDAAACRSALLSSVGTRVSDATSLSPKPEALMIWDLEGYRDIGMAYYGYPGDLTNGSALDYIAPEMERETGGVPLADELLALVRAGGMEPGLTLRGQSFTFSADDPDYACTCSLAGIYCDTHVKNTGNLTPISNSCNPQAVTFDDGSDTAALASGWSSAIEATPLTFSTTGTLPAGLSAETTYYLCNKQASNLVSIGTANDCMSYVTDLSGGSGTHTANFWVSGVGGQQSYAPTDAGMAAGIASLLSRIKYAFDRWGVRHFYIDSTGRVGEGGFPHYAWKAIYEDLAWTRPGIEFVLMPENFADTPWTGGWNGFNEGTYRAIEAYRHAYPLHWTAIGNLAGGDRAANLDAIHAGLRRGETRFILDINSGALDTPLVNALADMQTARALNGVVTLSTGERYETTIPDFIERLKSCHPNHLAVRFAASTEALNGCNIFSEQGCDETELCRSMDSPCTISDKTAYRLEMHNARQVACSAGPAI